MPRVKRTALRPLPGDEGDINPRGWTNASSLTLAERLWPKVRGPWYEGLDSEGRPYAVQDFDCWLWIGGTNAGGWRIRDGVRIKAYDRPGCCNPKHLVAVPHSENVRQAWRRGERPRRFDLAGEVAV
jgi:hypothetical protein